jgi:phosphotriesterase-related protein
VTHLITTLGDFSTGELGIILPHEHVFVDLRTWDQPGYGEGDADDVVRLMAPEVAAVQAQGVTAIVEPGPVGVGRRVDILKVVSEATGMPLVVPTGVYREPWLTPWARQASEDELVEWMVAELTVGVEETGVRAGFIKVGATDEGVTLAETKVLRAAARASAETGAVIGSHTVRGDVARSQVEIIEGAGGDPARFIWIHAHVEPDVGIHHELARHGVWLEYDGIGNPADDARFIGLVHRGLEAGFGDQLLLSHDRGWYDPAQPGGGTPQPYTYLIDAFLPQLAAAGIDQPTIDRLTRSNPFRAFAR